MINHFYTFSNTKMKNLFPILPTVIMNQIFDYKKEFNKALKADEELEYFNQMINLFPNISNDFLENLSIKGFYSLSCFGNYIHYKFNSNNESINHQTINSFKEDLQSIYHKLISFRKINQLKEISIGTCNPSWYLEHDNILYKNYLESDNFFAAFTFFNFFDSSSLYSKKIESLIIDKKIGDEYKDLNYRLIKYFQYVKFFDYIPWIFKIESGWFFEREFDNEGNDLTENYDLSEIDVDYTKISWVYNF